MRRPERLQRLRLAQESLLFTIAAALLLWCTAVVLNVVDGRHREQMAALRMPCAGDVPNTEVAVIRDVLSQLNMGRAPVLYERVGFSPDLKEAIVAVGRSCGGLCGQGALVRARWNGTRWEVAELVPTWIS